MSVLKPWGPSNQSLSQFSQHEAIRCLTTSPPLPPSSLYWYLFTLLGGDGHCERKRFAQEHNDPARCGTQTSWLESLTLTIRPLPFLYLQMSLSFKHILFSLEKFSFKFVISKLDERELKVA